jgi:hypothetical protein
LVELILAVLELLGSAVFPAVRFRGVVTVCDHLCFFSDRSLEQKVKKMASDPHTTHASSPADNERSVQLAHRNAAASGCAGLDMLLTSEPEQTGGLGVEAMQQRLTQMHADWPELLGVGLHRQL